MRPDLAPGCPERFDLPFLRYIWNFNAKQRPNIIASLDRHGGHLSPVIFRRDADVKRFLDTLSA